MSQILLPSIDQVIGKLPQPTPKPVVERLERAHNYALEIHGDRRRQSGELYIEHDRAVAYSIGEVGIDTASTTAGLLHDTLMEEVEGSDKQRRKMDDQFGHDVTSLVSGLNRLAPYTSLNGNENARQLEKLRRAILHAVDDDIRILLLRMADNLQDLLWAKRLPSDLRLDIAREASEIYAPIANRLGIWTMKWRLEDESFRHLQPDQYKELAKLLAERRREREEKIAQRVRDVMVKLEGANIKADVKGRSKHIYSIYRKMVRKNVPFDQIYDLRAMRIILHDNDLSKCYQVLGLIHGMWLPIPEEFDDYIANPKPNGYKSLHTAVYDIDGQVLEIQIRTRAMDDEAERGIAAHWAYKEGGRPSAELARRVEWLRHLLIDLRDENDEEAPTEQRLINIDDLSKRIYVFTPKRDVIELPDGGTPIDFSYQIHTEVGHRTRGAKVNGKMVPLNHILRQGDTVSIITAKRGGPSRDWMNESSGYAKSGKTRSKVRQWFRVHDREGNIIQGLEIIERELKRLKVQDLISTEEIAHSFKYDNEEDFLAKVGFGDIQFNQVTGAIALLLDKRRAEVKADESESEVEEVLFQPRKPTRGLTIQGLSGLHYRIANCCMPLPPEPIIGFITRGRGVTVHHRECRQFVDMGKQEPGRIIQVDWGIEETGNTHEIPLIVTAFRHPELAEDIATLVSGRNIKLVRTKSQTDKKGLTTVHLMVSVNEVRDLDWLMQKIRNMSHVLDVRRQRWASNTQN